MNGALHDGILLRIWANHEMNELDQPQKCLYLWQNCIYIYIYIYIYKLINCTYVCTWSWLP